MTNETQEIVDLIIAGWDTSNYQPKPEVIKIIDRKKVDIANLDWVTVYYVSDNPQVRGEHAHDFWVKENIQAIDIRLSKSHDKLIEMRDEVKRTIYDKRKDPGISGYDRLDILGGPGDLSDKSRRLFRWVLHVKMTGYYKQIVT
jgi:hypothetical protein